MKAISLAYHDVLEKNADRAYDIYALERDDFRNHLHAIRHVLGGRLPETIAGYRRWVTGCPVFLTFDDGAVGAYTCVADELERFGWRGQFFITTDWIGQPGFMTARQIRDLRARGHVVGSHSCSHPESMSSLCDERILEEWDRSCAELSGILGEQVKVASVPGGCFSQRVARIATSAGIEVLFNSEATSSSSSVEGCLVLGRYTIQRGLSPRLSGAIAAGNYVVRWRQSVLWRAKKAAKMLGGEYYHRIRYFLLYQRHSRNKGRSAAPRRGGGPSGRAT